MSFSDRSGALIELLEKLNDREFRYVLVGGYAVSAFNTRFSTDLDIVVAPDNREKFEGFLEGQGFEELDSHSKNGFTPRKSSSTRSDSLRSDRSASIYW